MQIRRSAVILSMCLSLLAAASIGACGSSNRDGDTNTPDAGSTKPDAGSTKPDAGTTKPDAGTSSGEVGEIGEECGNLDELGKCVGNEARWCDIDEIVGIDCAGELDGTCTEVPNFGSWCAVPSGSPCAFQNDDGSLALFVCGTSAGATPGLACDLDEGCVQSSVTCTYPGDDSFYEPTCNGKVLVTDCSQWNQPVQFDCTHPEVGGTGCASGACTGIAAGGFCDGQIFKCATGLTCNGTTKKCQ